MSGELPILSWPRDWCEEGQGFQTVLKGGDSDGLAGSVQGIASPNSYTAIRLPNSIR